MTNDQPLRMAFALAGLGGFNAHGAGFLTAARACGVVPELVTATSGQIVVLAEWLQGHDLEKLLVDPAIEGNPLAQVSIAVLGDQGVFRPAYLEALARWWTWPSPKDSLAETLANRLLPAQQYVPTRTPAEMQAIAEALDAGLLPTGERVAVVFNAYDVKTGQAVLFGNDLARKSWPKARAIPQASVSKGRRFAAPAPDLQPITVKAVQSALWLSLYGFEGLPSPHLVDGAYDRACIVAELHDFDRVFVARPLAEGWLERGGGPRNWFEVQDWQSEMWFSVGYKAEVDALHKINGLVAQGLLGPPFKPVDLIEIAPRTPAGYFNYFIERATVFSQAEAEARAAFEARGLSLIPAIPAPEMAAPHGGIRDAEEPSPHEMRRGQGEGSVRVTGSLGTIVGG